MSEKVLDIDAVCQLIGGSKPINRSTLYRGIKAGTYPRPVKIGPNMSRWREGDVLDALGRFKQGVSHTNTTNTTGPKRRRSTGAKVAQDVITEAEVNVLNLLGDAYNAFVLLPRQHQADTPDFSDAIHRAQKIVLARVGQRVLRASAS